MTIKELIRQLRAFDETHSVEMEVDTECGCLTVGSTIQDVQFKDGKCILYGRDY